MRSDFYRLVAADYDRMVGMAGRLSKEMPPLVERLRAADVQRLLDVGCALGGHAIALAQEGFDVTAIDPSAEMIAQAKARTDLPRRLSFHESTLDQWAPKVTVPFDGLICLGHTFPHLLGARTLRGVLGIMEHVLRPGGLMILQMINPRFVEARQVWTPPLRAWEAAGKRIAVIRHWVDMGEVLRLVISRMEINRGPSLVFTWRQQLPKVDAGELSETLAICGWQDVHVTGGWTDGEFARDSDESMLVTARRPIREGETAPSSPGR